MKRQNNILRGFTPIHRNRTAPKPYFLWQFYGSFLAVDFSAKTDAGNRLGIPHENLPAKPSEFTFVTEKKGGEKWHS